MVKLLYFFFVTVVIVVIEDINCSSSIADTLSRYYESELQKSFKRAWQKYKISYEHAIVTTLKENVGVLAMNVYVRHDTNPLLIAAGCIYTDNGADVLLFGLKLREMPHLIMPEVTLAPASNLLRLETSLSKIFIDTHYYVSRNDSTLVKYSRTESQNNKSPFSLDQVQPFGSLTIIAEDCFLSGISIITLAGSSLNVGHSPMRITDCKFTIEISANDLSIPPVIAPYLPKEPGKQIQRLLTKAFLTELVPKLQGTMYTFVNTTEIFGNDLNKFRLHQQKLFMNTADYMSDVCVKLNNLTLQGSKGHIPMSSLSEHFEILTDTALTSVDFELDHMALYGLDTAYAARTGGSFEAAKLSIADAIRFSSMQIRGKSKYNNGTRSDTYDFAAELTDVTVNVILSMDKGGSNLGHKFKVVGWRTMDFSILPWETKMKIRVLYQSLVTGYILHEVPARIIEYLSSVLTPASNEGDESKQDSDKIESEDDDADPGKASASEKHIDGDQNNDNKSTDKDGNAGDEDNDDNNNDNVDNNNDDNGNDNGDNDNDDNDNDDNDNDDNDNDNDGNDNDDNDDNDNNDNDDKDNGDNDDDDNDNNDNDEQNNEDNDDEGEDSIPDSDAKSNILIFGNQANDDNDTDGNDTNDKNNDDNNNDDNNNGDNDNNDNGTDGNNNDDNDNGDNDNDDNDTDGNNNDDNDNGDNDNDDDNDTDGKNNDGNDDSGNDNGDNDNNDQENDNGDNDNDDNDTDGNNNDDNDNGDNDNDDDNDTDAKNNDGNDDSGNDNGENGNNEDEDSIPDSNTKNNILIFGNEVTESSGINDNDKIKDNPSVEENKPISEIDADKNNDDYLKKDTISDSDKKPAGRNDNDEFGNREDYKNYDDTIVENDDVKKESISDSNTNNVILSFGNEDTKPAERKGIIAKKSNLKVNLNNNTHLRIQNKTLKGLSSKKLRSNNVRLRFRKKSIDVKQNISSIKKHNTIKMTSPHMSDNDII